MRPYHGLTKDGKWVHGWYLELLDGTSIIVEEAARTTETHPHYPAVSLGIYHEVLPETVGQQVGLKDKNGKDLDWWEGDIIQKGKIIRAITVNWEHGMRFMLGKHILCKQDGVNGTRIGNIHENPELLK